MQYPVLDSEKVLKILTDPKTKKGIEKYVLIKREFEENGVTDLFRERFCKFYRLDKKALRNSSIKDFDLFLDKFFSILIQFRNVDDSFPRIFLEVKNLTNRNEISFSSKLLHTIDNNSPIWDSIVRNEANFDIKSPNPKASNEACIEAYNSYKELFLSFSETDNGRMIVSLYESVFGDNEELVNISNVKKIDFVLWQNRLKKPIS